MAGDLFVFLIGGGEGRLLLATAIREGTIQHLATDKTTPFKETIETMFIAHGF
jgi:hypothetical protein